jgi:hypothetical protein
MNLILNTLDLLNKSAEKSRIINGLFSIYKFSLAMGIAFGIYRGLKSWFKYIASRDRIKIRTKFLEPIVNTTLDCWYLAFYVFSTTLLSSLVVATAPISVPLIIYFGK